VLLLLSFCVSTHALFLVRTAKFAFLEFRSVQEAQNALLLNGIELQARGNAADREGSRDEEEWRDHGACLGTAHSHGKSLSSHTPCLFVQGHPLKIERPRDYAPLTPDQEQMLIGSVRSL
jgi:hypothetical protein